MDNKEKEKIKKFAEALFDKRMLEILKPYQYNQKICKFIEIKNIK